ncbi:hypothetical protein FTX61_19120 [Nitriliruptoraceae bacterium ZYF776]|nr:hypothetical protein [Profundirhabdus halotolerans]
MAELVLGLGTSHGPLLNTPPDQWGQRARADRANPALAFRGTTYDFDGLLAARSPGFADECRPEVWDARHAACRTAIDQLGARLRAEDLDALVVVSSDHKEVFDEELLPPFAIYHGDQVDHVPFAQHHLDAMPPGLAIAEVANVPEEPTVRPCHAELAHHLLVATSRDGFDPGASQRLPAGRYGDHGIPHGWGFVYQQLLKGDGSVPVVPVFVNTFWEPNPPTARRCFDFGRALGAAVASFPEDLRVGIVASGGLSHMVVDEDLDRRFLAALVADDAEAMTTLEDAMLVSGTSELRNWIVTAGALAGSDLRARVVDYEPCYRSEAGTGCAMGFVIWDEEDRT